FIPPLTITVDTKQLNLSAHGSVKYNLKNNSLRFAYQRLTTNGSGLFAGANSDVAQASMNPRFFRNWATSFDSGYVRLRQVQNSQPDTNSSYHYWYGGFGMRRNWSQNLAFVASYQVNGGNSRNCASISCGGLNHTVVVGLTWHSRPVRLDRGNK